ncbi:hypothetical protein FGF04_23615 [Streptomyces apricus]|uniref:Uncharacterized protein n=1 Tax=Streptomyces apricus TaxID=1828112 RepID=A0A5B0AQ97_9ACTN|nr:hypothetical protein FGF04_23615 [Streptomyces apricus]
MPSLTVVVSSDTDICFSPGLYGDCLPTVATVGAADSFRAGRRVFVFSSHARTPAGKRRTSCGQATADAPPAPLETLHGIHVTWTLWASSK